MNTPAHTPTPWEYTPMADGRHHVIGILCTAYRGEENAPYHPLIANVLHGMGHAPRETADANARFIVRACNSHAALVAALEALLDSSIAAQRLLEHFDPEQYDYPAASIPAHRQARAALAGAKE